MLFKGKALLREALGESARRFEETKIDAILCFCKRRKTNHAYGQDWCAAAKKGSGSGTQKLRNVGGYLGDLSVSLNNADHKVFGNL